MRCDGVDALRTEKGKGQGVVSEKLDEYEQTRTSSSSST